MQRSGIRGDGERVEMVFDLFVVNRGELIPLFLCIGCRIDAAIPIRRNHDPQKLNKPRTLAMLVSATP